MKYLIFLVLTLSFKLAQCQLLYKHQANVSLYVDCIDNDINQENYLVYYCEYITKVSSASEKKFLIISPNGSIKQTFPIDSSYNLTHYKVINGYYYYVGSKIINDTTFMASIRKCDANFNIINETKFYSPTNFYPNPLKISVFNSELFIPINYISSIQNISNFHQIHKLDLSLNKLDSTLVASEIIDLNTNDTNIIYSVHGNTNNLSPVVVHQVDRSFNALNVFVVDSFSPKYFIYPFTSFENSNLLDLGLGKYAVVSNGLYSFDKGVSVVTAMVYNNRCISAVKIGSLTDKYSARLNRSIFTSSFKNNNIYTVLYGSQKMPFPFPQNFSTLINLHKVDGDGNLIWSKFYGGDKFYYPNSVLATEDSGAVICGSMYDTINPKVPGAAEGFVMKIDKDGNQEMVSVLENHKQKINVSCFPNPSKNEIAFSLPNNQAFELRIYDMQGKEVITNLYYNHQSQLNIKPLNSGAYFYTIKQKELFGSGRFVKE